MAHLIGPFGVIQTPDADGLFIAPFGTIRTEAAEPVILEPYWIPDSRLIQAPELFEPGRKPATQLAVNWNNDLTRGLKVCHVFQDTVNLANNRQGALSGAYIEADKIHFDGSNDEFTLDDASRDDAVIGTDNCLILAKAKYLSGDQDYPTIAHAGRITGSTNWVLAYDTLLNRIVFIGQGGLSANKNVILSDGEEHVYSVLRDGTTVSVYVDDEKGSDQTSSGDWNDDTPDLELGSASTAEYYWKGDLDYFFLWVGLENPAEVLREILRDPFQILKPAIDLPLTLSIPAGTGQTISPNAIASSESFGSAVLTPGSVALLPAGIASAEAHGSQIIVPGLVTVDVPAIASAEAFGDTILDTGASVLAPAGIGSAEALGTAALLPGTVTLDPAGVGSEEAFGTGLISPGLVQILAAGIASAEAHGAATVTTGAVFIDPASIVSAEAFGAAGVLNGTALIAALGINSAEAFGSLVFQPGAVTVDPAGIGTGEAFGALELGQGALLVAPPGIASGELFGDTLVIPQLTIIEPAGIGSQELFGTLTIIGGAQLIGWLIAEIQARAALDGSVSSTPALGADIRINWDG